MKRNIYTGILTITLVLATILAGCNSSKAPQTSKNSSKETSEEITVAAAADLTNAFKEIGDLYENSTGNKVKLIFSSSGTLREQIENGAPYDVYASANIKFIEDLIQKDKIIADTKELHAIGRVGVGTVVGSSLQVKEVTDLLKPEYKKIAMANPEHAPYGLATKEALESLGLWEKLEDKFVYGKDIQDTLTLVKSGNVEAGFISLSVAKKDEVNFMLLDDKLHNPLKQGIAVVKGTKQEALARDFIKFVNGEPGREVMKKYGFSLPGEM